MGHLAYIKRLAAIQQTRTLPRSNRRTTLATKDVKNQAIPAIGTNRLENPDLYPKE